MTTIDEQLVFNGINGATGGYLLPKLTVHDIAQIAQGKPLDQEYLNDLKYRHQQVTEKVLGIKEDGDPNKLSEAGWGVIFAYSYQMVLKNYFKWYLVPFQFFEGHRR